MSRSPALATAFVLFGLSAACSSAPPADAPDYEVNITSGKKDSSANSTPPKPAATTDPAPAPPPNAETGTGKTAVTMDGQALTITGTTLWSEVTKAGEYSVFLKVTGTGVADGSDINIWASATQSGCVNTTNYLAFRPTGDTQYMPKSPTEPQCGLTVTSLPTAVGGRFQATFEGTLYGIGTTSPRSKQFVISVDVLRDK
jgi:hypothetical protein